MPQLGAAPRDAGPAGQGAPWRCDLIVLTWNRRDLLQPCLERLMRHTPGPIRLLIVDNGTTDPDALAYLESLRSVRSTTIEIVRLARNERLATAINAGLTAARAPWICLLNNDVLVTEGWLDELIRVAEADPGIGLVNPMSSEFNLWPRRGESIDEIARRMERHRGATMESPGCVGFCMLIPARVLKTVGGWDERFRCYFEDADYSARVRAAGWRCVIAEGTYVYHAHGATLDCDPDQDRHFREGEAAFYRKWPRERLERIACVITSRAPDALKRVKPWLVRIANRDDDVQLFLPSALQAAAPRHLKITLRPAPGALVAIYALWKLATMKKRVRRIVVMEPGTARLIAWLKPLHRAAVSSFAQEISSS